MFGIDFWLGYIIGSSDNTSYNSYHEKDGNGFFTLIFFLILIGLFVPAMGILGYEIGEEIKNINLLKWGISILCIYLLTFKSMEIIIYPSKKIFALFPKFSNEIILNMILLILLLLLGYTYLFIESKIDFISDNKVLNGLLYFYQNLFADIVNWLFKA